MVADERPQLSIILVTKNRARYLERFFRNIEEQIRDCSFSCELIVIDGASTDGAVNIIRDHERKITSWISEQDSGVSEAFNKGLAVARGAIIKGVGDEDEFLPGAMSKGVEYLRANADVDCAVFHAQWFWEEESGERRPAEFRQQVGRMTLKKLLRFPYSGIVTPESGFTRRQVFERAGGYDLSFHYWAYLDVWLRQLRAGFSIVCVPEVIMRRIQTNDSDGTKGQKSPRWQAEFLEVIRRHGGLRWVVWHRLEGDLRPLSLARRLVRFVSQRLFGTNPRSFLARFRLGKREQGH